MFAWQDTRRSKKNSRFQQQNRHKLKDDVGIFQFNMLECYINVL